jgi:hypothetical protein
MPPPFLIFANLSSVALPRWQRAWRSNSDARIFAITLSGLAEIFRCIFKIPLLQVGVANTWKG